jgi:hypothetical protein
MASSLEAMALSKYEYIDPSRGGTLRTIRADGWDSNPRGIEFYKFKATSTSRTKVILSTVEGISSADLVGL